MTEQNAKPQSLIIGGMTHVAPPRKFWTVGKVIFFLVLAGFLAGGGYYAYNKFYGQKSSVVETPTYTMKLGTLEISVTEEGSLESLKSQPIRPLFNGQAKIEWIVAEETVVKEGDDVLRFDRQDLQKSLEDMDVRLKENESSLVRAKEDDIIAVREDEAAVERAEKDIENAYQELDKFLNSDVPRKKEEARLRIRKARQTLREIETDIAALPFLIEKELKTLNDLEKAKIELETRKNALQTAEEDYRIYLEYDLPKQLAQKRESVENAIRSAERTKNNIESKAAQRVSNIRQVEKNLETNKKRIEEQQQQMDKMTLKAPCAGIIYYGAGSSGRDFYGGDELKEQLKPGNQLWTGQDIMHVPDTSKMKVAVNILESDISKIAMNLPAIITVPSLDNANYTGKVSFKARSARPIRYWDPTSSKVVQCEILIDGYDERLTPGSTVKCKIIVKQLEGVLTVPVEYIFERDGHPVVYLKTGPQNQAEARRVKLGDNNSTFVVIEEGLKAGDEIYQFIPPAADSAPVTGAIYKSPEPSVVPPSPNGNGAAPSASPSASPAVSPAPEGDGEKPKPQVSFARPQGGDRKPGEGRPRQPRGN
jgi:HlyD family secretion protein